MIAEIGRTISGGKGPDLLCLKLTEILLECMPKNTPIFSQGAL
jgi:hypothetical protein